MIKNYLKIAWRNIIKNKSFSFINIMGLAASMAVCLLIIAIFADKRSYDNFQSKKDNIYRVHTLYDDGSSITASSALPLAEKLRRDYAGVEASASLVRRLGGDVVYNDKFATGGGYFADGELFNILDFKLAQGNPQTALQNPFSLVISEEIASQLFYNENPIGKTVKFNDKGINPGGPEVGNFETEYGTFTITGILKPNGGKTHLPFKLLASLSTLPALAKDSILNFSEHDWDEVWYNYTYVLMRDGKTKADVQKILDEISKQQYNNQKRGKLHFVAKPLTEITQSDPIGNETSATLPPIALFILGILCLIILLSACLNYTNLSVARALTRAKEVGVRKVMGAKRSQIFAQFIAESVLISLFSFGFSLVFLELLKAGMAGLWLNRFFEISTKQNIYIFFIFLGFSILVGIIAGLLPSLLISSFNPIHIFKNFGGIKLFKRLTLRKALLVVQFTVSLIFIITSILINRQAQYMLTLDYGFDRDNVVNVKLYKSDNYQRFAQSIATNRAISAVSACALIPASTQTNGGKVYKSENTKDSLKVYFNDIDAQCLNVWNLKLVAGRNLPDLPSTIGEKSILVNELLVKKFNYPNNQSAIGQRLLLGDNNVEIIGVVKDFQFLDVTRKQEPLVLRNRSKEFGFATIKMAAQNIPETLAFLEKEWKKVNPNTKYEYEFFDKQTATSFFIFNDMANVLSFFTLMAVLISILGLFGMATFTAETRQKEIGIRKVLGANALDIIYLLSKNYLALLGLAILIATPSAYFFNALWLNYLPHRIAISSSILVISIFILLIICFLTVFSQSWRASKTNPVESLKTE